MSIIAIISGAFVVSLIYILNADTGTFGYYLFIVSGSSMIGIGVLNMFFDVDGWLASRNVKELST